MSKIGTLKNMISMSAMLLSIGTSFAVGYSIGYKKKIDDNESGILRIDNSDPECRNQLFLELTTDLDSISNADHVVFSVSNKNYIRN